MQIKTNQLRSSEKAAFWLYSICWDLAIPFLRKNRRIKEGFHQRTLKSKALSADLWIQAASAGESYLAWSILKELKPRHPIKILLTSNTTQGIKILKDAVKDAFPVQNSISVHVLYFPFDKPAIMDKAVKQVKPKTMVILETEIWPGLLLALKESKCKILLINGRMTQKSLNHYLFWPSIWEKIRPDKILAISLDDKKRFARLFGKDIVATMPNIKFDRIKKSDATPIGQNPLSKFVDKNAPFVVLGSIRQEEEDETHKVINEILRHKKKCIIGLFPRHMHRTPHWEKIMEEARIPWVLRSKTKDPVLPGTVILWDIFGELGLAYAIAETAFVGGSLKALGGQNFLEPLSCGVRPVIGPHWENFSWVGREIIDQDLVFEAEDWQSVVKTLVRQLNTPDSKENIKNRVYQYLRQRQGGTKQATDLICRFLNQTTI